jgi:hypothetical protein
MKLALHGGRNGVGSRFRARIHHMVSRLAENDSRPLPAPSGPNATGSGVVFGQGSTPE